MPTIERLVTEHSPKFLPLHRDDVVFEEIDGEAVVFDPSSGAVHQFDGITLRVWKACDATQAPDNMARALSSETGKDGAVAETLVRGALAALEERGLIVNVATATNADSLQDISADEACKPHSGNPPHGTVNRAHAGTARATERTVTRRAFLGRSATKIAYAAPMISTFCVTGTYAAGSNPIHAGSPLGPGGCKNVGFSCAVNTDCCEVGTRTACQDLGGPTKTCCVKHNEEGCIDNADCCNQSDVCSGGQCLSP